jgi:hypothetical protein
MDSASFGTAGPKAETPAKPAKKATVVQRSAALGLDLAWQTVSMGPFPELQKIFLYLSAFPYTCPKSENVFSKANWFTGLGKSRPLKGRLFFACLCING